MRMGIHVLRSASTFTMTCLNVIADKDLTSVIMDTHALVSLNHSSQEWCHGEGGGEQ